MKLKTMLVLTLLAVMAASLSAAPVRFQTFMDGPSESPPVPSPGTGFSYVLFDTDANSITVYAEFQDLVGTTTVAHIHAPTAMPFAGTVGVAFHPGTFPGWPAGVTSGTYMETFNSEDPSIYTPAFLAAAGGTASGAEALLFEALSTGRAYFNVHTTFRPGGEIRGFYTVPEPASVGLAAAALVGLIALRRRFAA